MKRVCDVIPTNDIQRAQDCEDYITELQRNFHQWVREIPEEGITVEYAGIGMKVLPTVFPPYVDSIPMLEYMRNVQEKAVLDVGTGSGVLSIIAALRGARKVVGLDINKAAVECAAANARAHSVSQLIEFRASNVFSGLKEERKFDMILANLPFRVRSYADATERNTWDRDGCVQRTFFGGSRHFLRRRGQIVFALANFSDIELVDSVLAENDLEITGFRRGENLADDPRIYYALRARMRR